MMRRCAAEFDFARLAEVVAPGKDDLVALIETYFDESYNDGIFCVAGYVLTKNRRRSLDKDWRSMLRYYKIPYFRMSACAHGNYPFDKLSPEGCIKIEKRAIAIIKKYAVHGIAVSLDLKQFKELMSDDEIIENEYMWCVWHCLFGVRVWADRNHKKGDIAYFFESGDKYQTSANKLMNQLFSDDTLKQFYRYSAHAFVDK